MKLEKKFFCGLDPSLTGSGVTLIDNEFNVIEQKLICTSKQNRLNDTELRLIYIVKELEFLLKYKENLIVYIEGLSFGSKGLGMLELGALHYLITIFLLQNEILFYEIPPTRLKKFVTGKGQCKKNLMLLGVYKKWGVEYEDDNAADSYSLARMAEFNRKKGE